MWLAKVGSERLEEIADPEKAILRGAEYYRAKGYPEGWINQRLQDIEQRIGHMDVVKTLSESRAGLSKSELANKLGTNNNGHLSELLEDLENCDFISRYNVKQKKISAKKSIYRLKDMYSIFFLGFSKVPTTDHVDQILSAIGVRAVHTEYYSWRWQGDEYEPGAQIDLVIERDDRVINVCEIKYCSDDEYLLDSEERKKIAGRISSFRKNTGTKYGIVPTQITTYGLKKGINSGYFNGSVVTISDLLKF